MATHALKEPVTAAGKEYKSVNVRELRWKQARRFAGILQEKAGNDLALVEAVTPFIVEATGLPETVLDEFALSDIQAIIGLMQGGDSPLANAASPAA